MKGSQMKILVLCDDKYHPAQTVREGLSGLAQSGYELNWVADAAGWRAEQIGAYPVVVLAKSNHTSAEDERPWMTDEVQQTFTDYVRQGNGLLAIHSGTAGYEASPRAAPTAGRRFHQSPPAVRGDGDA
jgi:uncharacterized protein